MRVLDEVATAIDLARDRSGPRAVVSEVGLEDQFAFTPHPSGWDALRRHLDCGLPPLAFVHGHWFLPDGLATVWDLVDAAADAHPDWEPPAERTEAAWRDAQVFVGVRDVLVDALAVEPERVTRETRLIDIAD